MLLRQVGGLLASQEKNKGKRPGQAHECRADTAPKASLVSNARMRFSSN